MPGGQYDSSRTRVAPIFDQLRADGRDWIRQLLTLPRYGSAATVPAALDLTLKRGCWGPTEHGLVPPVALLSWLVRNLRGSTDGSSPDSRRARLIEREPAAIEEALALLRTGGTGKSWYVLEGATYPDVFLETPSALIVIEGKRTEAGPTTKTKWMSGRHQMWRHLDAAWEIRGSRAVYGFFLVEGQASAPHEVPGVWIDAAAATLSPDVVGSSLPHRGDVERREMAGCFLGVATWQHVCSSFGIAFERLPDTVPPLDS